MLKGKVIEQQLYSSFLNENISLMIYLPEHYSPLYSYPTLYVQDAQDYFSLGQLPAQLDRLIEQGSIERCLAIGVTVPNQEKRENWHHKTGTKHLAYTRFFAEELVPYIDEQFASLPISGGRAIMGEKLGGAVSLAIALSYPQTFHYVIMQSGTIDGNEILEAVSSFAHSPSLLYIYQSVGKEETKVPTSLGEMDLLNKNRQLKQSFEKIGFPLYYREFEGDQNWAFRQQDMTHALSHIWVK